MDEYARAMSPPEPDDLDGPELSLPDDLGGPELPLADDVAEEDLRAALVKLLANRNPATITMRTLRPEVATSLGLAEEALDGRAEEVQRLAVSVCNLMGKKIGLPHSVDEDLGEEKFAK